MAGKIVGYARVSTTDQNLDSQIDELSIRCEKIFTDKISGAKSDRPGLSQCLEYIREGDTLIITKLDRLGRSLNHVIQFIETLKERGISLVSLHHSCQFKKPRSFLPYRNVSCAVFYVPAICLER
jgi:DNA invertase Pin-like site-specific DNA recombinase